MHVHSSMYKMQRVMLLLQLKTYIL